MKSPERGHKHLLCATSLIAELPVSQIRERVWQMMKDIKAMERHVTQQNILNTDLKDEVSKMTAEATKEKTIVNMLVKKGMDGVRNKVDLLREAVNVNVTGVREALGHLDAGILARQDRQDRRLDELEKARKEMVRGNKDEVRRFANKVEDAEKSLKDAKKEVESQRDRVKHLIYDRIQSDIGNLDEEMRQRFSEETRTVQSMIREGIGRLDRNVSDFSMTTGTRIAHLVSNVDRLKKMHEENKARQDSEITQLEKDQKFLSNRTVHNLEDLRRRIEENRITLSKAREELEKDEKARRGLMSGVISSAPLFKELAMQVPALREAMMPQLANKWGHVLKASGGGGRGRLQQ